MLCQLVILLLWLASCSAKREVWDQALWGRSYSHPLAHRECCPAWLGHMGMATSHAQPKGASGWGIPCVTPKVVNPQGRGKPGNSDKLYAWKLAGPSPRLVCFAESTVSSHLAISPRQTISRPMLMCCCAAGVSPWWTLMVPGQTTGKPTRNANPRWLGLLRQCEWSVLEETSALMPCSSILGWKCALACHMRGMIMRTRWPMVHVQCALTDLVLAVLGRAASIMLNLLSTTCLRQTSRDLTPNGQCSKATAIYTAATEGQQAWAWSLWLPPPIMCWLHGLGDIYSLAYRLATLCWSSMH